MRLREEDEDDEDVVAVLVLVLPLPLFACLNALAPLASGDDIFFQRRVVVVVVACGGFLRMRTDVSFYFDECEKATRLLGRHVVNE